MRRWEASEDAPGEEFELHSYLFRIVCEQVHAHMSMHAELIVFCVPLLRCEQAREESELQ